MPDQYKDIVLRDAFLNGLKDSFQNVLLKKKIAKLEDAYREAQVLEYSEATKGETAVKVAQMDGNAAERNRFQNSASQIATQRTAGDKRR